MSSQRFAPKQGSLGEQLLIVLCGLLLPIIIIVYIPLWLPAAIRDEMKR